MPVLVNAMDEPLPLTNLSDQLAELAALYALDILEDAELEQATDLQMHSSDFATIIEQDSQAASLLAYAVPPLPLPADLKDRLFQKIVTEPPLKLAAEALAKLKAQADLANWEDYTLTPGTEFATLELNEERREFRGFVRSFGQVKFPEHRHAGDEEIVVLAGELIIGDRVYLPGDRILSQPGTQHQPETMEGVLLFLQTSIDDEMFVESNSSGS
jgi:hypothetical protein